jgi:hypothetical protein
VPRAVHRSEITADENFAVRLNFNDGNAARIRINIYIKRSVEFARRWRTFPSVKGNTDRRIVLQRIEISLPEKSVIVEQRVNRADVLRRGGRLRANADCADKTNYRLKIRLILKRF